MAQAARLALSSKASYGPTSNTRCALYSPPYLPSQTLSAWHTIAATQPRGLLQWYAYDKEAARRACMMIGVFLLIQV
jgi:hypothetical protein